MDGSLDDGVAAAAEDVRSDTLPSGHVLGVISVLWAVAGFAEWFLVLRYVEPLPGPLAYAHVMDQLLVLQAGALVLGTAVLARRTRLRPLQCALYAAPPFAYLAWSWTQLVPTSA
ncbi:MAG: hypothetical protein AAF726_05310 [Planctomycetota bacterium]